MRAGVHLLVAVLVALALAACPPPGDGCVSNADCPAGEVCNAGGECKQITVPPPRDASRPDLGLLEDAGPGDLGAPDTALEDAAPEDAAAEDAPPEDALSSDLGGGNDAAIPDAALPDTSAPIQVSEIVTCDGPSAAVLDDSEDELYVACTTADDIHVYSSVLGRVDNNPLSQLYSLPSPCQPSFLHLREDLGLGQLWVSCSDVTNQKVFNVNPATGSSWEDGFDYGGTVGIARMASGGDRVVFVGVGDTSYYLRRATAGSDTEQLGAMSVLNRGSDVAIVDDASIFYLVHTLEETGRISRRDQDNGLRPDIFAPTARNSLIEVVPGSGMLIISNDSQLYSRVDADGFQVGGVEDVEGVILAMAVHPGGDHAYISTFDSAFGWSTVYQISTDPAESNPTLSEQRVLNCQAVDLEVASDGRVFVVCPLADRVRVISF